MLLNPVRDRHHGTTRENVRRRIKFQSINEPALNGDCRPHATVWILEAVDETHAARAAKVAADRSFLFSRSGPQFNLLLHLRRKWEHLIGCKYGRDAKCGAGLPLALNAVA